MGLAAHVAGAGRPDECWEILLLLPKRVMTGMSPWDWSNLPDSCAPEQRKHIESLAEGRPPFLCLSRLVPSSLQPSWRLLSMPRLGRRV